ncbi:hypothetical protein STRAU_0822 [Streptomyces aurantiacus JA 4570]|uniref:Cupin type-1 domain-containing protein n=1 Tax=Streptomyces aurantiacus JA 4570 TaxID=1286094 RepID=S3ZRT9_9ACTN|nr:hypothetical protein STRAU_0822 [Streptomyces aurantiacus JA 4570]
MGDVVNGKVPTEGVRALVLKRWAAGNEYDELDLSGLPSPERFESTPWVPVDCMQTKLIGQTDDGVGFGLDQFAPQSEEKSYMHIHPHGDRVCTAIRGRGTFFALKDGQLIKRDVRPGDVVVFPRNVPHAFWGSRSESLMLHVVLNPLVAFDHPEHTVKSPEGERALREAGLID